MAQNCRSTWSAPCRRGNWPTFCRSPAESEQGTNTSLYQTCSCILINMQGQGPTPWPSHATARTPHRTYSSKYAPTCLGSRSSLQHGSNCGFSGRTRSPPWLPKFPADQRTRRSSRPRSVISARKAPAFATKSHWPSETLDRRQIAFDGFSAGIDLMERGGTRLTANDRSALSERRPTRSHVECDTRRCEDTQTPMITQGQSAPSEAHVWQPTERYPCQLAVRLDSGRHVNRHPKAHTFNSHNIYYGTNIRLELRLSVPFGLF